MEISQHDDSNTPDRPPSVPNIDRAVSVAKNLASVLQSHDSPNRDSDIAVRKQTLKNMGIHPSWYSDAALSPQPEAVPWFEIVGDANRMSDPDDRDFGLYEKTRANSGIVAAYNGFYSTADLGRSIADWPNALALQELRAKVGRFKSLKERADLMAQIASKIADNI